MNRYWWINGKMTNLTKTDAVLKLIDVKSEVERYGDCCGHKKWTDAVNMGIEAIQKLEEIKEILDDLEERQACFCAFERVKGVLEK